MYATILVTCEFLNVSNFFKKVYIYIYIYSNIPLYAISVAVKFVFTLLILTKFHYSLRHYVRRYVILWHYQGHN